MFDNKNNLAYIHDNQNETNIINSSRNARNLINSFFDNYDVLIGLPNISISAHHVVIQISYFAGDNSFVLNNIDLISLQNSLANNFANFGLSNNIEIRLIKLTQPYLDATILAKYFSEELETKKFPMVMRTIFRNMRPIVNFNSGLDVPSCISGIKVQVSGVIESEKNIAQISTKIYQLGSITNTRNTYLDIGSYSNTNEAGTYTVKVWLCVFNRGELPNFF